MIRARWIGLGRIDPIGFHASYAGVAEVQAPDGAPIVVWGRATTHVCLGQSQGLCELDDVIDVPVVRRPLGGGVVWVDEDQHSYAIVAPLALAPRRHEDWYGWALAPAISTFRTFGLAVERHGEDLWLGGRKIAGSGAATIGGAAVVASSFLLRFPSERFADAVASPSGPFRAALHAALGTAMTDWASQAAPPGEGALAAAFGVALCETLGWSPQPSGIEPHERAAIDEWREELAVPIERGRRRVAHGIKLNAALALLNDERTGVPRLAPA